MGKIKLNGIDYGGGGGGHTIIDENGSSMPQRAGLQFTGDVSVNDDSVNDKTVVVITNSGGTTHTYSTSEQVVGTWIDGKPLYECTISVDNPTKLSASGKYYYDVIYNRSDIEYAQLAFCSVFDSVDGRWFPLPYQRIISSENIDILAQARADGSFQVTAHFPTSAWYNLTKIRYTVQYTKTTD